MRRSWKRTGGGGYERSGKEDAKLNIIRKKMKKKNARERKEV